MRDYFEVLGVQRKYHFSDGELERRFHELSKKWHPDRFTRAEPRERIAALAKGTEINDAYKVLKLDVKRAEHLLKLEGLDVADEKSESVKAAPALLAEVMELNEQLVEAGDDAAKQALWRIAHDKRHAELS